MTDLRRILIRGDGVAAACCAHLLRKAGLQVRIAQAPRRPAPVVLLSETALALVRDVFDRPDLLADQPRVEQRIVAWGGAEVAALPHPAISVPETILHDALMRGTTPDAFDIADFTIHAADPLPAGALRQRFGDRLAYATEVALTNETRADACWVESTPGGWLFLLPGPASSAWLLAVGAPHAQLLDESRLIAPRVKLVDDRAAAFDPCPRLISPAAGEDWLACGATAMAFDPICGDGTAQAIRQAILASATLVAIAQGGQRRGLLSHYDAMLTATMRRHLMLCADFYRTGGPGAWWSQEAGRLAQGHAWCTAKLAVTPERAYRLQGFELVPQEPLA